MEKNFIEISRRQTPDKEVSEIFSKLELEENSPCFCMGKIGNDPYCPCEMRRRGLNPTDMRNPEVIAEFDKVLLHSK